MRRNRFNCANNTNPYAAAGNAQNTSGYKPQVEMPYSLPNNTYKPMNYQNGTTTYEELAPIMTCSKNVVNQYHVVKQPYVHTYHTEVVHHHIKQAEYIPNYTCSEVHVQEAGCMNR